MQRYIKLANSVKIPQVALGTAESATSVEHWVDLLKSAFKTGYRHIDTAILYQNQQFMGPAINQLLKENYLGIKREDIFITSKIFPHKDMPIAGQVESVLKELELEYIDNILIHTPVVPPGEDPKLIVAAPQHVYWKELESQYEQKLCRVIGVSNYNVQNLYNLLSFCNVKPQINQVEISPYLLQTHLKEFCDIHEIAVAGYANLARGGSEVKNPIGNIIDLFNEPILLDLSKKYQKTISQIVLNYLVNLGYIVLPKSTKPERLQENFNFDDFKLEQEDIDKLKTLNTGIRTLDSYTMPGWGGIDIFA